MQDANATPHCKLCGDYFENNFKAHKSTELHRFNFLLFGFNNYRKRVVADQGGIIFSHSLVKPNSCDVTDNFMKKKGSYNIKVSPLTFMKLDRKITVQLKVNNGSKSTVAVWLTLLHPYPAFSLTSTGTVHMLRQGESFTDIATINFQEDIIGSIKMPIALTVQSQKQDSKWFNIYRDVVLHVKEGNEEEEYCKESPFTSDVFNNVVMVIGPTNLPPISNNYPIPGVSMKALFLGLKYVASMSIEEGANLRHIIKILTEGVTEKNYADFFHYLLWLDEAGAMLGLQCYNMTGVTVKLIRGTVELMVPGLAEKRPSVLVGDVVGIRVNRDHTFYQGVVNVVTDKSIFIKEFDEQFFRILQANPALIRQLDVRFEFQRLQHERMHKGVDKCIENKMLGVLFPKKIVFTTASKTLQRDQLFNKCIMLNKEQKAAVENILSCTSGTAPYIVFGPPGTGKTVTIVEAILQLKTMYPKRNILICAPSNAACDMLAQKLIEHKCTEAELIRVHSTTRDIDLIPVGIRRFSNLQGADFLVVRGHELKKYKIVISTLHLIGKYTDQYSPDYLFIDEAAQATEPECDIAIGLLAPNKQIILAGDPKQLGPVITSKVALKYGLETSLLERLMNTIDIYSPIQRRPLTFNPQYITMLVKNFRSHEGIIHIPNTLFYGGALECHADLDPISKECVSQKVCGAVPVKMTDILGVSVEFCGVVSKEARTGSSPSFFNEIEIQMVVKFVTALIQEFAVRKEDIGVISPYIRQVHRIKQNLCGKGWENVEVGTTEAFQGREKRVMIISTVRAQHSLLRYDKKYNLGFVKNKRRFNVALTRAKAKLIVVGNPLCLGHDKECWGEFIEFCQEYKMYFGMDYQPRTDRVKNEIIDRLKVSKLKIKKEP